MFKKILKIFINDKVLAFYANIYFSFVIPYFFGDLLGSFIINKEYLFAIIYFTYAVIIQFIFFKNKFYMTDYYFNHLVTDLEFIKKYNITMYNTDYTDKFKINKIITLNTIICLTHIVILIYYSRYSMPYIMLFLFLVSTYSLFVIKEKIKLILQEIHDINVMNCVLK